MLNGSKDISIIFVFFLFWSNCGLKKIITIAERKPMVLWSSPPLPPAHLPWWKETLNGLEVITHLTDAVPILQPLRTLFCTLLCLLWCRVAEPQHQVLEICFRSTGTTCSSRHFLLCPPSRHAVTGPSLQCFHHLGQWFSTCDPFTGVA